MGKQIPGFFSTDVALFKLFLTLEMEKYLEEALENYEQNMNRMPSFYMDASVLLDIEEFYQKSGRIYEAERCLEFALHLHPDNDDVKISWAYHLKSQGRWQEACEVIDRVCEQGHIEVQLFRAEFLVASGDTLEALLLMEKNLAQETDPLVVQDWILELSALLLDYGFYVEAKVLLSKLKDRIPENKQALSLSADVNCALCAYSAAEADLSKLLDLDPYDVVAWIEQAQLQFKAEHFEQAVDACDYALAIDRDNRQAMVTKLEALFAKGDWEEGMRLARDYARSCPDDYHFEMIAAQELLKRKDYGGSVPFFSSAMRKCPIESCDRGRILLDFAKARVGLGQFDRAEALVLSASTTGREFNEVCWQYVDLLLGEGERAEACAFVGEILKLESFSRADYVRAVRTLFEQHAIVEAEDLWIALAKKPYMDEVPELSVSFAYVFRQLHYGNPYLVFLEFALEQEVADLRKHFAPIFLTQNVDEYLALARKEVAQWGEPSPEGEKE